MCIIQRYTKWNCGCPIEDTDQALVKICVAKARNAEAKCTLYVVPAFGESLSTPDSHPSTQESFDSSSSDSGDSDGTCDSEEYMADSEYDPRDRDDISMKKCGLSACSDDDDKGGGQACMEKTHGTVHGQQKSISSSPNKPDNEIIVASEVLAPDVKSEDDCTDNITDSDNDRNDDTKSDVWYNPSPMDDIYSGTIRPTFTPEVASPRMCPEHEARFENFANAYWRSETMWLRPKMPNHGRRAVQDFVLAQRCADRLWELYLVWKFFNGGDPHGAVIATSPDFKPLYRSGSGVEAFSISEEMDRKMKGAPEVDGCCTLRSVSSMGDITYNVLQWALDDLLTELRDMLHPLEMLA
ncbi:hypothetical protein Sste5346_003652 [Sporothrix stenoceras]|uniref:Uncharacterized protein n=1 Tax=Sporothrix stenoceras TaxID=5173 RepID=A0ABR3ZC49_9PEZI